MDIYVAIGKTTEIITMKKKIIVGLLVEILIMVKVHGVIHLVGVEVGTGVTYQYLEVRKSIPIQIYRSGVNQI
jgi:hypothetical protein